MTRKLGLLLTATIDPKGMAFTRRASPKVRLKDYKRALSKWSANKEFDSIVFCENSRYDLSSLHPVTKGRVHFLSFSGNEYPRELGKGVGEMNILRHAIDQISHDENDLIVKVTGRYFIRNANNIIADMRTHADCEVFCEASGDEGFIDSRIFAGSVNFMRKFLIVLQDQINDTDGIYFEHVLADAVRAARTAGMVVRPFTASPQFEGISGTFDRSLRPLAIETLCNRAVERLRRGFTSQSRP